MRQSKPGDLLFRISLGKSTQITNDNISQHELQTLLTMSFKKVRTTKKAYS